MQDDTVIRFSADHQWEALSEERFGTAAKALSAWREVLMMIEATDQHTGHHRGGGHQHVSARTGALTAPLGRRAFMVSGTQSSRVKHLKLGHFALVESYDYALNRVVSHGEARPPAEALTHAGLYDASLRIRCVLHAHSPKIWNSAERLQLPMTDPQVEYGTPEMALEVQRLYRETELPERRVLKLSGHEDGVIAFGISAEEAGSVFMSCLVNAIQLG